MPAAAAAPRYTSIMWVKVGPRVRVYAPGEGKARRKARDAMLSLSGRAKVAREGAWPSDSSLAWSDRFFIWLFDYFFTGGIEIISGGYATL